MKINNREFNKWIKALRSGEYSQTRNMLQDEGGYCCLGVGCEVLIADKKKDKEKYGYLIGGVPYDQEYAPRWLKGISYDFAGKAGATLDYLNDKVCLTFDEIADLLEAVYVHKVLD